MHDIFGVVQIHVNPLTGGLKLERKGQQVFSLFEGNRLQWVITRSTIEDSLLKSKTAQITIQVVSVLLCLLHFKIEAFHLVRKYLHFFNVSELFYVN